MAHECIDKLRILLLIAIPFYSYYTCFELLDFCKRASDTLSREDSISLFFMLSVRCVAAKSGENERSGVLV